MELIVDSHTEDGWATNIPSTASTPIHVGDTTTAQGSKTYRGILSFPTGCVIPLGSIITGASVKAQRQGVLGNPGAFGSLYVDVKTGFFGSASSMGSDDYASTATGTLSQTMPYPNVNDAWVETHFTTGELAWINSTCGMGGANRTQVRLRFGTATDNDGQIDRLSFNSGEAEADSRPKLTVSYITCTY